MGLMPLLNERGETIAMEIERLTQEALAEELQSPPKPKKCLACRLGVHDWLAGSSWRYCSRCLKFQTYETAGWYSDVSGGGWWHNEGYLSPDNKHIGQGEPMKWWEQLLYG